MAERIGYQQIFQATSNGVLVTDNNGIIVEINRQAEKILGFRAATHRGAFICDVLPLTGSQVMDCLATGKTKLGHQIIGKKVDLVLNITLIKADGRIQGAVCSFQEMRTFEDVALKLEAYKRLNKQLETIFKASSDGIWVCDGAGRVISINSASERLNGIKAKSVVGRSIEELVAEGLFDRSVTLEVLESRRQVSLMQYVKRTQRHLLATGTPAFEEDGSIYLVVVNERDMTDLNAMYEELEQHQLVTAKIRDELAELSLRELEYGPIVAESEAMQQILRLALKLAHILASNILILGESGTGKGLLAKFIHKSSKRRRNPFIQINCATLPESLLEAELFGYEQGAFTGAREKGKAGLIELADGGTLFLDEIGDMPLGLQAKLLKYLDDNEIMRLGGTRSKKIDCTVIAATNQMLEELVRRRRFRRDLYYRLNTFSLRIPPLRERREDVFELARHFLRKYNQIYRLEKRLGPGALERMQSHAFPGNVRELKNLIKKAVVMSEASVLDSFIKASLAAAGEEALGAPGERGGGAKHLNEELDSLERKILKSALRRHRTTRKMAAQLGVSQSTIVRKLKKHGLEMPV